MKRKGRRGKSCLELGVGGGGCQEFPVVCVVEIRVWNAKLWIGNEVLWTMSRSRQYSEGGPQTAASSLLSPERPWLVIGDRRADGFDRNFGEEASRIIYGFTPINGPSLGSPTMTGLPSADDMADLSFTPPKSRKSSLPVRTPIRLQGEGPSQLWTPPPTKRNESSRAVRSNPIAESDSPRPKKPRRKVLEATETSTQDWMMVSKQAQSEAADEKLDSERDFMVSRSARNKLDSFRYQSKCSDHYQSTSLPDVPPYQSLESYHPVNQPMESMSTTDPVSDLGIGLTGISGRANGFEAPDEHCMHSPARTVALEKSFVSSAKTGSPDVVNGTKLFTGRQWVRSDIGSGSKDGPSSVGPSDAQGQDTASNEDSASNPAPLGRSENCVAKDSDNGQLGCIEIREDVEQTIHQHLLTLGAGDGMDPFEDTASFQGYNHVAHTSPTLDDPEDEFLLDDNDIDDVIEVSGGQGLFEPSSSLHLSSSQGLQVDNKSFPKRTDGFKATSAGKDIFILNDGVYARIEATTTMGALNSDLCTSQSLRHARANIGRKWTATNTAETKLGASNDEEVFDLDEEDEAELADATAAISQDCGETLWHFSTAPPVTQVATPTYAPETALATSIVPTPSSPAQPPPRSTSDRRLEPFVRPPFPKQVRDRSPIVDVSSSGVLRTCFRIGEALNAASLAFRTGTDVIIEIFARVSASTREQAGYKQHIDFVDLFHSERPPFLSGTYELWRDGGRWEEDSRRFLDEGGRGKMCRAVGRLKRDQDTKMWKMAVLNIWEAGWDDVAWAKGIVCA